MALATPRSWVRFPGKARADKNVKTVTWMQCKSLWIKASIYIYIYIYILNKWKWSDVTCGQVWWPIIRIFALHLTHPSAHTQQWTHTHTHCEHTPGAVGRQCCGARGAVAQGSHISCGIEGGRERWLFTPPTNNSCQTWDSNSQPSCYKSKFLYKYYKHALYKYVCVCVHIYIYIYICICICVCKYTHTYLHKDLYTLPFGISKKKYVFKEVSYFLSHCSSMLYLFDQK